MIVSYPASPSRIILLLKTLRHIIVNLEKKSERKERGFRENRKKESFSYQMQQTKRARKPFDVLERFWSKLNEFN